MIEFRSIIDWCQRVGRPLCFRFLSEILFRLFVRGPQSVSGQRPFWIFSARFVRFYSIFSFFSGHFFFFQSFFLSLFISLFFSFLVACKEQTRGKSLHRSGRRIFVFHQFPRNFLFSFLILLHFDWIYFIYFFFYKREIQFSSPVSDISPRPAVTHPSIIIRFSLPSDWN